MCLVWPSIIFPKVQEGEVDFSFTEFEASCVASFLYVGEMLANIPTSYLQTAFGRRRVLLFAITFQMGAWPVIYFLRKVWAILLARILMGIWVGFYATCCPVFMSEISPYWARGRIIGQLKIMDLCGFLFQTAVGTFASYGTVAIVSYFFIFVLYVALLNIPESVYFLVKNHQHVKAERNLQWLRGNEDVKDELARIEHYLEIQMSRKRGFMEIFRWPPSRKAFFQSLGLSFVQKCSAFTALSSYASFLVPDSWVSAKHYPIVWTSITLICLILSVSVVDLVDRKVLLQISTTGTAVFTLLVALWFYIEENTSFDMSTTLWVPMVGLSLQSAFYAFGFLYLPVVYQAEVFAMNVKAKAGSMLGFIRFAVAAGTVQIFIPLQRNIGHSSNLFIYFFSAFCGCFICINIIETRNKNLELIQRLLEGRDTEPLSFA
ncbi:uncharacterized protein isoform X2 [Rhodnius prolixus]